MFKYVLIDSLYLQNNWKREKIPRNSETSLLKSTSYSFELSISFPGFPVWIFIQLSLNLSIQEIEKNGTNSTYLTAGVVRTEWNNTCNIFRTVVHTSKTLEHATITATWIKGRKEHLLRARTLVLHRLGSQPSSMFY